MLDYTLWFNLDLVQTKVLKKVSCMPHISRITLPHWHKARVDWNVQFHKKKSYLCIMQNWIFRLLGTSETNPPPPPAYSTHQKGPHLLRLRRRQISSIFDPYPPPSAVLYYYPLISFGQFLTPAHPLKDADVLNGWSLQAGCPWVCRVCHGTPRFWQIR